MLAVISEVSSIVLELNKSNYRDLLKVKHRGSDTMIRAGHLAAEFFWKTGDCGSITTHPVFLSASDLGIREEVETVDIFCLSSGIKDCELFTIVSLEALLKSLRQIWIENQVEGDVMVATSPHCGNDGIRRMIRLSAKNELDGMKIIMQAIPADLKTKWPSTQLWMFDGQPPH
ncbi:hypothetical protein H6785_03785 [Candidatus Nomurabacteria bacterium]|nr:hypothetical protein [Candidatus Nomurabacteria bacterium]